MHEQSLVQDCSLPISEVNELHEYRISFIHGSRLYVKREASVKNLKKKCYWPS